MITEYSLSLRFTQTLQNLVSADLDYEKPIIINYTSEIDLYSVWQMAMDLTDTFDINNSQKYHLSPAD